MYSYSSALIAWLSSVRTVWQTHHIKKQRFGLTFFCLVVFWWVLVGGVLGVFCVFCLLGFLVVFVCLYFNI